MEKIKINHPHILVGAYCSWLRESNIQKKLNHQEFRLLYGLMSESFGYLQQYTFLSYNDIINNYGFSNRNSISKSIKSLIEKKLIKKVNTQYNGSRGKNKYQIILPDEILNNYEIYWRREKKSKEPKLDELRSKFTHQDVAQDVIEFFNITEDSLKKDETKKYHHDRVKKYFKMDFDEYTKEIEFLKRIENSDSPF